MCSLNSTSNTKSKGSNQNLTSHNAKSKKTKKKKNINIKIFTLQKKKRIIPAYKVLRIQIGATQGTETLKCTVVPITKNALQSGKKMHHLRINCSHKQTTHYTHKNVLGCAKWRKVKIKTN